MQQMYKVMSGSIIPVEVSRVSEDSVWEVTLNGSEVRKLKAPKSDKQPAYFQTLDEAKAHLLVAAGEGVAAAKRRLEIANARYQQISAT